MNKEELLKEVWNNFSFEDILTAGLELNKITSSDIIQASDIYKDPNHEYTDNDLAIVIEQCDLGDICHELKSNYKLDEILNHFSEEDILDTINDTDIICYLEGTWTLSNYIDDIRLDAYNNGYNDAVNEYNCDQNSYIEQIKEYNINEMWCWLCKYFDIGYYDSNQMFDNINNLCSQFDKTIYKNKDDAPWVITREK